MQSQINTWNERREIAINPRKVLTSLKQMKLKSTTWHFERCRALQWFDPSSLVAIYNTIVSDCVMSNQSQDSAWLIAISAVLSSKWIETVKTEKFIVWQPSTNTYMKGPGWDMVLSIPWEELYKIKLRYPQVSDWSAKTYAITVSNVSTVHDLLEGGESLEWILQRLSEQASNRAMLRLANTNKMIWNHRLDFQARIASIINERKGRNLGEE